MKKKISGRELLMITVAMFVVSAAVYFFMIPSKVVVGSISGVAMVLAHLIPIPISILTFLLNVILLIIGFFLVGKEFGVKTVYTSTILPVFLWIFEQVCPLEKSVTGNIVFDLIAYVLLVALGQAILFRVNASSGGVDIIAKLINKFTNMEIGKAVTVAGMATATTSVFAYGISTMIISLIGTYANGLAVDYFIDGFNKRKRVCIITDDYKEVQDYILHNLNQGATLYVAQGAYDEKHRMELVTVLAKQEYRMLINYLKNTNKQVFVTVSTVNEIIGNGIQNRSKSIG